MNQKKKVGYMCRICYDWELGEALGGSTIYPSLKDLKNEHKCWEECGIVKVTIKLDEIIDKGQI